MRSLGGMATRAVQLAALEAELAAIITAMTAAQTGGQSFTLGDMSVTGTNYGALASRRTAVEKSIQRLKNGGRGIAIDLAYRADGGDLTAETSSDE